MTKQTIIDVATPAHQAMVDITDLVAREVRAQAIENGVINCFVLHTTCALTINENADPDVVTDLLRRLERLVPWHDPADRHAEGNSAAHLRSSLLGCSLNIPISGGKLQLGTWQGIYLCEFDGPRRRKIALCMQN
jgi:secondary thiamine-phosphate synthase enzyme